MDVSRHRHFLWILFLDTVLIILVVDQDTPSEESPDCCI